MKKKLYYKLNRYQVTKVEVKTAEQEQAVKMLNREMDRFTKSEDTYRERYASLDEMYEESGFEPADDSPTPEEQFLENEKKRSVNNAIAKLKPRQQQIIYMFYFEEKTQEEIAKTLGVSQQAISENLPRLLAKLKKILSEQ